MADEPGLPRLTLNRSYKRIRRSPTVSSDPPTFSSDDDPSADNYTSPRRKRTYKGPWYCLQSTVDSTSSGAQDDEASYRTKRSLRRQFDSGVFMASDETETEAEASGEELMLPMPSSNLSEEQSTLPIRPSHHGALTTSEFLINRRIEDCLETGNEMIDLTNRNLSHLCNESIRPLAAFARIPTVTQDSFTSLEPQLRVFLSANRLTALPGELFNLPHLAELSLRGNKIYDLPPAVGNCKSIISLNLGGNRLRYLPYEILDLFCVGSKLETCLFHPNIYYQPIQSGAPPPVDRSKPPYRIALKAHSWSFFHNPLTSSIPPFPRHVAWSQEWSVLYRGRSAIRYFDINGTFLQGPRLNEEPNAPFQIALTSLLVADSDDIPTPPVPRGDGSFSRAPSLLEVSLRACSTHPQLPVLESLLPADAPPCLTQLLQKTHEQREAGGSKCTVCKRDFVVKRTEWIEWWEISKSAKTGTATRLVSAASPLGPLEDWRDAAERCIPLIRRGCSWKCAPERVAPPHRYDGAQRDVDGDPIDD